MERPNCITGGANRVGLMASGERSASPADEISANMEGIPGKALQHAKKMFVRSDATVSQL